MLKELTVADKTYYYDCNVKGEAIEYLLYDSNETWIETKTKDEVLQTTQQLNKRIKHDVAIAFETLQNSVPESATWVGNDNPAEASNAFVRILKLKYRVKGYPFHFEWHLKQHNDSLIIQLPIDQVSSLVDVLPAKIEELLGILQRKEHEIHQYRREYGSLRRSTLATNIFDVETFREQYAVTDMNVKSLQRIVAHWRSEHENEESTSEAESSPSKKGSPSSIIKKEEPGSSTSSVVKTVQESPRSRKRKALHSYKTQMMRSLQSGKKELEYESQSQSQSQSQSLSENELIDTNEVKKVRENVEDIGNVTVNEVASATGGVKRLNPPRRSVTRNSPKPLANTTVENSTKPSKEVASNVQKLSPRVQNRPNTRQRRRECEMSEPELMETTGESAVAALNESFAPVKNSTITKTISSTNDSNNVKQKIGTSAQNLVKHQCVTKVELTKSDLSTYVDLMLSKLEALDKEVRG